MRDALPLPLRPCAAFLLAAAATVAAAAAFPAAARADDVAVERRVQARIDGDARLRAGKVDVDVQAGVATLTGTVESERDKARAERLAKVAGVTVVNNRINIAPRAARAADDAARRSASPTTPPDPASDVGRTLGDFGHRFGEALGEAGGDVSDSWITTQVKSQLANESASTAGAIRVDTAAGVVTLRGTVASQAIRRRAVAIARATRGVVGVVDKLRVGAH